MTNSKAFRVGLTGGIASGKSTVAKLFAALGVPIIDTDQVAREVVEPGQPPLDSLVERFGRAILTPDGHLDRPKLREIVFSDPKARADLEALTHPAIGTAPSIKCLCTFAVTLAAASATSPSMLDSTCFEQTTSKKNTRSIWKPPRSPLSCFSSACSAILAP